MSTASPLPLAGRGAQWRRPVPYRVPVGGNADIAAAKTIDGGIGETFARYGGK
jgi:hypothetical protein